MQTNKVISLNKPETEKITKCAQCGKSGSGRLEFHFSSQSVHICTKCLRDIHKNILEITNIPTKDYYDIVDIAAMYGLTEKEIRKIIMANNIKCINLDNKTRIKLVDIHEYMVES